MSLTIAHSVPDPTVKTLLPCKHVRSEKGLALNTSQPKVGGKHKKQSSKNSSVLAAIKTSFAVKKK